MYVLGVTLPSRSKTSLTKMACSAARVLHPVVRYLARVGYLARSAVWDLEMVFMPFSNWGLGLELRVRPIHIKPGNTGYALLVNVKAPLVVEYQVFAM